MQQAEPLPQAKLPSINLLQPALYAESTSQSNSQDIANSLIFYVTELSICHGCSSGFYYHPILHPSARCRPRRYPTAYTVDHSLLLCNLSSMYMAYLLSRYLTLLFAMFLHHLPIFENTENVAGDKIV